MYKSSHNTRSICVDSAAELPEEVHACTRVVPNHTTLRIAADAKPGFLSNIELKRQE